MSENAPPSKKPDLPKMMPAAATTEPVRHASAVNSPFKAAAAPQNPNTGQLNHFLLLQRTVGNHATQQLLQREPDPAGESREADPTPAGGAPAPAAQLSDREVRSALAYYTSNSTDYSADIIRSIQGAVGRPQTGTMVADDIQAIATFQRNSVSGRHSLEPDGVAGTRTLAVMFPFGMARQSEMDTFVGEFQTVVGTWATLTTPQARTTAIVNAVNNRLTAAGVTVLPTPVLGAATMGSVLGEFTDSAWTITINPTIVASASLTADQQAGLVNTVYHEARHCEQVFNEARMLAGRQRAGTAAATIAQTVVNTMGVPNNVAQAAAANPLNRGSTQHLIAQGMYEAFYGRGASNTRAVYRELGASRTELRNAQAAFDANGTPANQRRLDRARARRQRAWNAYHNLPEEHDAFWQGDRMEATYRAAPPPVDAISGAGPVAGATGGAASGAGAAATTAGGSGAAPTGTGGPAPTGTGGSHPLDQDPLASDPYADEAPEVREHLEQEGIEVEPAGAPQ